MTEENKRKPVWNSCVPGVMINTFMAVRCYEFVLLEVLARPAQCCSINNRMIIFLNWLVKKKKKKKKIQQKKKKFQKKKKKIYL